MFSYENTVQEKNAKIEWKLIMKIIEIRRHSKRGKDKGLTAEGRRIARIAAKDLKPPYTLLISSPKRRARETMEAFGFKNYSEDERFMTIQAAAIEEIDQEAAGIAKEKGISVLEAYFLIPKAKKALKDWGKKFFEAVIDVSKKLKEGEKALIVSHGGSIEPAALLAFDEFDLKKISGPLDYCEGIKFYIDKNKLVKIKVVRLKT